jgi:alkaline phosphatase
MVEWDTHADNLRRGLDRMVAQDRAIQHTARGAGSDTLLMVTADHSFDIRVRGGQQAARCSRAWRQPKPLRFDTNPDPGAFLS